MYLELIPKKIKGIHRFYNIIFDFYFRSGLVEHHRPCFTNIDNLFSFNHIETLLNSLLIKVTFEMSYLLIRVASFANKIK